MKHRNPPRPAAEAGNEALSWLASSGNANELVQELRSRDKRRRRGRVLSVIAAAAVLGCAGFFWRSRLSIPFNSPSAIVLAPRKQTLPDGSRVELNPVARIEITYDASARRIVLQNGEAHFQVQSDPTRPFIVTAGGVTIQAVGTAFAVQFSGQAVEVLVTEGRVTVEKPASTPTQITESTGTKYLATLDAGNFLKVEMDATGGEAAPIVPVTPSEQSERLSWRIPSLEFAGTPLKEAIPLFNQYAQSRLVLDPSLGELKMSGAVRADETESLLMLLKNEFRIRAEPGIDGEIVLRR